MSEKRDLWVPAVLFLGGVGLCAWNVVAGSVPLGILALLVGATSAVACLPMRLKQGQPRVVAFGAGMALMMVPAIPGAADGVLSTLPWIVAGLAFAAPIYKLTQQVRVVLLAAAGLFALLACLALLQVIPASLAWLFLAGAFHLAAQVWNSRPRREKPPPPGPRIVVFGGSFDPFHRGHRALAEAALKVADRLLVVPAGQAPHKGEDGEPTPFHHRFAMCRLGVEGLARTEVLQLEGRRPGPSYTIDTLDVVRSSFPVGARMLLLLGADMYQDFPNWREWERILEQVTLLVARREGSDLEPPPELEGRNVAVELLNAPLVDVSSTELRRDIGAGRELGDRVQPSVQAYIREHRLYELE
ncbi:MAG: nicotinate (nicotinamide) nucleotide adenylyltransferase [Planctomycetota bacterium]|jgi:nicotinate-nucleotide adenylyltransferase